MSPTQHGEVFVTQDGAETDLDLGHYERFIRTKMTKRNMKLHCEESLFRSVAQRATRRLFGRNYPESSRILLTKLKRALSTVPRGMMWRLWKWAVRSAILDPYRFWKPCANWQCK